MARRRVPSAARGRDEPLRCPARDPAVGRPFRPSALEPRGSRSCSRGGLRSDVRSRPPRPSPRERVQRLELRDRPTNVLTGLRETVRKLPGSIYRAKGVVHSVEEPERRAVLQAVGRRVDISIQERWRVAPRTRLVVIGAVGGVDESMLEAAFASCAVAPNILAGAE